MIRFDPRRTTGVSPGLATIAGAWALLLASGLTRADNATGQLLNRATVMDGLESSFQQASNTRTPDGRNHQHLKTVDPACVVFLDINSGIAGEFQSAQLLARISDDPAAGGKIPPCGLEIANRFFRNVIARTPEGAELARHAVADALANAGQAYSLAVGGKTASVRFAPDLHGLFAMVGADAD